MAPGTLLGHSRRPRGSRRQSREVFGGLEELGEHAFGRFFDLKGILVNVKSKKIYVGSTVPGDERYKACRLK